MVLAAGIAGAACGPAAAACGGAMAGYTNVMWDITDSAIAGENKGVVAAVEKMADGKADIGDIFDFSAGKDHRVKALSFLDTRWHHMTANFER